MRVFISADIEGVGGVVARTHWDASGNDYRQAREWMAQEVNAAIEGAVDAGAERIVVKDAHDTATNIPLDKLHPAAELISGWGPLGSMVEGVDHTFDAVFLIGYHAQVGTPGGTLAHTWSSHVLELLLNGQVLGEAGWAAAYAGHFNVPVALVTGDDKLAAQATTQLPGVRTVVTKEGLAYNAARMRPLQQVRDDIRQAAATAVREAKGLSPFRPVFPAELIVRFRHWECLYALEAVPGVERIDVRSFRCRPADAVEAQKYFATLHRLARSLNTQ